VCGERESQSKFPAMFRLKGRWKIGPTEVGARLGG
jgi:hypothetical protein